MRHKRIALSTLSAALLLSGCNTDKAVTTTADMAAVTEEVTTTTTAATTASTTTEPAEIKLKAPSRKPKMTFGVRNEFINNDAPTGIVRSPFDYEYAADGEGYLNICSAPADTFIRELRRDENFADAVGLIEKYADGDALVLSEINGLPQTVIYHIFEDKPIGHCCRLDDEHLIYILDPQNVTLFKKTVCETAERQAIEMLWANYDALKPMSVTAVYDVGLDEEQTNATVRICPYYLKLSASAEAIDAIKKYLKDNDIYDYFEYEEVPEKWEQPTVYVNTALDNWELPGFFKPEKWCEIYTFDEAKEHFNELSNNEQPDSPEETIVRLMNRNIIAFNIETGRIFDYHIDEYGVWDQDGKKLYEASSPYFASLADIKTFIENTYTAEEADRLINGNDRHIPAMTEENGQLMLDITGGIRTWNTDPFANRTYIEVTGCTDDTITFEWHSIDWEPYGYDYESTYGLGIPTPHHYPLTFHAVKENGEWRLANLLFDNPELEDIDAESVNERDRTVIDRWLNWLRTTADDEMYNGTAAKTLYGEEAWELVKERAGIDFPLPEEILNGDKNGFYYDGTGFYCDGIYDARTVVGGQVMYVGNCGDPLYDCVLIKDSSGHCWLYYQLTSIIDLKAGHTAEAFEEIGITGAPGLYQQIRYAFRIL